MKNDSLSVELLVDKNVEIVLFTFNVNWNVYALTPD